MKRRVVHVSREGEGPLWRAVAGALGVPPKDAQTLVRQGAVYLNGRRCAEPQKPVREGEVLTLVLEEAGRSSLLPAERPQPLSVLFEDASLLAVNKPPGLPAQPTPGRLGDSLLDLATRYLGRPAGLVHRLDKDTSGVTVFGASESSTSALAAQFRAGTAEKRYLAVAGPGLPDHGEIDWPISKDPARPGRQRASRTANGRPAQTRWRVLARTEVASWVELWPKTGRTHQLRAHPTALGAPMVGDALYGGAPLADRCLLHAASLTLKHPASGAVLELAAPLPQDFADALSRLGLDR